MTGLAGNFATMPLRELVLYLGNRRASGTLHFERRTVHKWVTVREGAVVKAGSDEPREYLGQFLINMGHLTEEQFERGYQQQRATRVLLGQVLVREGLVPESLVRTALDLKFRETLLEALQWGEGSFRFEPGERPGAALAGLDVAVDLRDVHGEAEFRETAWQAIRAAFPSGRVRLEADPSRLPAPPTPASLDARILQMVQEGLTIDDMLLALHSTDFLLYQRLYALYRQDVVRPRDEAEPEQAPVPPPSVLGAECPAGEVRAHARTFLAAGNARDAEALARRARELDGSEASQALVHEVEAALLAGLQAQLVTPPRVPRLAVPAAQLRTLGLGAAERYLLSRVDGVRDVATIARVSPLRELDALKAFQDFVARGLIQLDEAQPPHFAPDASGDLL